MDARRWGNMRWFLIITTVILVMMIIPVMIVFGPHPRWEVGSADTSVQGGIVYRGRSGRIETQDKSRALIFDNTTSDDLLLNLWDESTREDGWRIARWIGQLKVRFPTGEIEIQDQNGTDTRRVESGKEIRISNLDSRVQVWVSTDQLKFVSSTAIESVQVQPNGDWSSGVEKVAPIDLRPISGLVTMRSGSYVLNAFIWRGAIYLRVTGPQALEVTVIKHETRFEAVLEPQLERVAVDTVESGKTWRLHHKPTGITFYVSPNGDTIDVGFLAQR